MKSKKRLIKNTIIIAIASTNLALGLTIREAAMWLIPAAIKKLYEVNIPGWRNPITFAEPNNIKYKIDVLINNSSILNFSP